MIYDVGVFVLVYDVYVIGVYEFIGCEGLGGFFGLVVVFGYYVRVLNIDFVGGVFG